MTSKKVLDALAALEAVNTKIDIPKWEGTNWDNLDKIKKFDMSDLPKLTGDTSSKGGKSKKDKALSVLEIIGNAFKPVSSSITNQAYNWFDGDLNSKDLPPFLTALLPDSTKLAAGALGKLAGKSGLIDGETGDKIAKLALRKNLDTILGSAKPQLAGAIKNQVKNWKDDELTSGDVFGAWKGYADNTKTGYDILTDHAGVKNRWGAVGGGLALDIALDPLTYLTLGASAAGKVAQASKLAKIAEIGQKAGVKVTKEMLDDPTILLDVVRAADLKKYPNLAKAIDSKYIKNFEEINGAFNKAHNANVNKIGFSVPNIPFTKTGDNLMAKLGKQNFVEMGELGAKNPLFRSEAVLGKDFAHVVDNIFNQNKVIEEADKARILKERYGVTDPAQLTKTMVEDLSNTLQGFSRGEKSVKNLPQSNSNDFLRNFDAKTAGKEKEIKNVIGNGFDELQQTTTKLEKSLAKKNPFDARTFKSKNDFVNSMAGHSADAMTETFGNMSKYRKALSELEKLKTGLSKKEEMAAIYKLEGNYPEGWSDKGLDVGKVDEYAGKMKILLGQVAKEEQGAGLLDKMIKDYFPHVKNFNNEELKGIAEFIESSPVTKQLLGKRANNAFNQERTGFRTIADRDNVVMGLHKELAKADIKPERDEQLRELLTKLENMYNLDTSEVILKRVKESVRAKAMKKMQGEFKKFGMLATNPKRDIDKAGLKLLSPEESKRLGLGEGQHYMHPEVLEGIKRVDEMFTDKGMNQFMRILNGTSGLFRTATTVFIPKHYINNYLGNMFINTAAGVTAKNYEKAIKLVRKYNKGKDLTKAEQKIIDSAFKKGVINGGYMTDTELGFTKAKGDPDSKINKLADGLENANKKLLDTKVAKFARNKGEEIDDYFRLANYLNGLEKFNGNGKLAAEQVRKFLFNYTESTNADRHARAIIPFWNWIKRNVPLQMKLVMENPKYAQNMIRFKELFNKDEEGADWQKDSGIKIGNQYLGLPFPTNDLETLGKPIASAISSSTPLVKSPIELSANKQFYTGNPITYGEKDVNMKDALDYLFKSTTGVVGKTVSPFYDDRNEDMTPLEIIRKVIASLGISTYDVQK